MSRQSVALKPDQLEELCNTFKTIDIDGSGEIKAEELDTALECVGIKLPGYRVRMLIKKHDADNSGAIGMKEFETMYEELCREQDFGHKFKKQVTTRKDVETHGGSGDGITHSVGGGEKDAFVNWINDQLSGDPDCKARLPIDPSSPDLYLTFSDGILLCKLINISVPDTIDVRTINMKGEKMDVYRKVENLNLALSSAAAIGVNVVNIGHDDLRKGTPHLVLGLLWQIIRIGLLSQVNLISHPGLVKLLQEGEELDDLKKLSPEQLLIRWVNYQLDKAGCNRQIANFSNDIKDSEAYIYLLNQIAPKENGVGLGPLSEPEGEMKAEAMLMEADKLGCRAFVTSTDVVKGNARLNMAFVANLFNNYPALEADDEQLEDVVEETREEKTYRNWMNSLGVKPFVHYLYNDLRTGQVIFQLYHSIDNTLVDWQRVHEKFNKMRKIFEEIENCNYAVELGLCCKFSLVGIQGKDIHEGNEQLTLALVWQLMKAYTLSLLSEFSGDRKNAEKEVLEMSLRKLKEAGKTRFFTDFRDSALRDSYIILDLIDAISPGKVNFDVVKSCETDLDRAKYAVSMGRKIGARIYCLPEDIVDGKKEMILTFFIVLCALDQKRQQQQQQE